MSGRRVIGPLGDNQAPVGGQAEPGPVVAVVVVRAVEVAAVRGFPVKGENFFRGLLGQGLIAHGQGRGHQAGVEHRAVIGYQRLAIIGIDGVDFAMGLPLGPAEREEGPGQEILTAGVLEPQGGQA